MISELTPLAQIGLLVVLGFMGMMVMITLIEIVMWIEKKVMA